MTTWQPIETAPKDGQVCLLGRYVKGPIGIIRIWVHEGYFEGSWKYDWNVNYHNVDPTHWQPLPEPPKEEESK